MGVYGFVWWVFMASFEGCLSLRLTGRMRFVPTVWMRVCPYSPIPLLPYSLIPVLLTMPIYRNITIILTGDRDVD
jgi:hypothetical protein